MKEKKEKQDNLLVGKADVNLEKPAHTRGVHEGNARGNYARMAGHNEDGTSTAARSTGIDPERRNPILPGSPNLSPP